MDSTSQLFHQNTQLIKAGGEVYSLLSQDINSIDKTKEYHFVIKDFNELHSLDWLVPAQMFHYLSSVIPSISVAFRVSDKILITFASMPNSMIPKKKSVFCIKATNSFDEKSEIIEVSPFPFTVIDVSVIGRVTIERPGIHNLDEIQSITPIELIKPYQSVIDDFIDSSKADIDVNTVDLVLGPKEIINGKSNLPTARYYKSIHTSSNSLMYNMGSIQSPFVLIKNLYQWVVKIKSGNFGSFAIIWVDTNYKYINDSAYFILSEIASLYPSKCMVQIKKSYM